MAEAVAMAVLLVLGSVVSLQLGAAFASQLFGEVGAAGATTLRLSMAALVLMAIARPRFGRETFVLGATLAGMNGMFYLALDRIPLGVAVTVEFLGPLGLAAALSRRPRDVLWAGLALVGVVVLGLREHDSAQSLDMLGVLFALVAGGFWAAYVLAGSRVAGSSGAGGLAGASLVAAVLTMPLGLWSGGAKLFDQQVLMMGLVVAVMASVVPYSLELRALKRLSAKTFGILLALEPAAAALAGALLLGQHVGLVSVGAIVLVVVAGAGAAVTATPRVRGRRGKRVPPDVVLAQPVPQ